MRTLVLLICLLLTSSILGEPRTAALGHSSRLSSRLTVRLDNGGIPVLVYLQPDLPGGDKPATTTLLRSTSDLNKVKNVERYPVAYLAQDSDGQSFTDYQAPENVKVYYRLHTKTELGKSYYSNVVSIKAPLHDIGTLSQPFILIDKLNYVLLLVDGDQIKRSFPVALGQNSVNRKLHFDRASTPEGVYTVDNVQPRAQYYKALDLNYPNTTDRARYDFFRLAGLMKIPAPAIGGEIQIHGDGIKENWTWGCVALRNRDMDWLFSRPEISVGTKVYIAGSEITPDDLLFVHKLTFDDEYYYRDRLDRLGYNTGRKKRDFVWALSRYQMDHNLKVTGILDVSTADRLYEYD